MSVGLESGRDVLFDVLDFLSVCIQSCFSAENFKLIQCREIFGGIFLFCIS